MRYVVVVHGIGEQRKNETVLAVVNRFAEARRTGDAPAGGLTLGIATGQTGKETVEGGCRYPPPPDDFRPWLEFKGIPLHPASGLDRFLGEPDTSGENLRFVDLWWADMLRKDFGDVGQEPGVWTEGLLARLDQKAAGASPEEAPPTWARVTVREVRELALRIDTLLRTKAQALRARIFNDFLGDVQIYGEYAHCRGIAVRRFHRLLARVEAACAAEFEQRHGRPPAEAERPRYTVVAHSLGSVMALDALLYAHAREDLRTTPSPGGLDLPFPEYVSTADLARDDPKVPVRDTSWIRRVDAFVTLGSPIDKYLVLWWQNYRYLNVPHLWMDPEVRELRKGVRIRHYNYADEQDPVGHNLDVAATAPAMLEVFDKVEDVVFNRYKVPGVAHNAYWGDRELFAWILARAVDGRTGGTPPRWFDPGVYRWALLYAYRLLPLALLLLSYFALSWGFYTSSWHGTVLAAVAVVLLARIGGPLMRLLVWWRQLARLKWCAPGCEAPRDRASKMFRHEINVLQLLAPAIMFSALFAAARQPPDLRDRLWLVVPVLLACALLLASAIARAIDGWLLAALAAGIVVGAGLGRLLPGGHVALNVFLLGTAATVIFSQLRRLIYAAKDELGVAKGAPMPKLDYPRYADASGVDIPPPQRKTKPPRPRKPRK
ncbi:MAG TPA: hypothetical protein VFY93_14715 [Planctomycetota bacterium]|nr:hypothetical protein [Planctomycetota bacterium]